MESEELTPEGDREVGEQGSGWGVWHYLSLAMYASTAAAVGFAANAICFDGQWAYCFAFVSLCAVLEIVYWTYVAVLKCRIRRREKEGERLRAEIRSIKSQTRDAELLATQQKLLASQLRTEIRQTEFVISHQESLNSQLRVELYEAQRLLAQREAVQLEEKRLAEQRETKTRQLEAMAIELETQANQLELRLEQAHLWGAFVALEEDAQDRIREAYETGFIHAARGVSFVSQSSRHLRIVNPSA